MKERITVLELLPDGRMVKHIAMQWRANRKPGRKPKRKSR